MRTKWLFVNLCRPVSCQLIIDIRTFILNISEKFPSYSGLYSVCFFKENPGLIQNQRNTKDSYLKSTNGGAKNPSDLTKLLDESTNNSEVWVDCAFFFRFFSNFWLSFGFNRSHVASTISHQIPNLFLHCENFNVFVFCIKLRLTADAEKLINSNLLIFLI